MSRLRNSYQTWFSTPRGREVVFYGIFTAAIGTGIGNLLPHTFFLHKYQEFVQMYQSFGLFLRVPSLVSCLKLGLMPGAVVFVTVMLASVTPEFYTSVHKALEGRIRLGIPVPVPQAVKFLMEKVMNDMGISERERKFIKAFTVFGFDVFHAGTTSTKQGAIVGIPSSFAYNSTEDVDKSNIIVSLKQVNWNSSSGKILQEALVLSENARKFAIGRELYAARTPRVFLNSVYPACIIAFIYGVSKNTNDKLGLLNKHISVRLVFYSLIGLFGIGTWAFLKDYTAVHYEIQADKEMCKLGEHYIKGGLEFYSKLLLRNKALRELMGEKGAKIYAVTGNEQYMLRQKHLPLTLRKEYMENRLKELKSLPPSSSVMDANVTAPA